MYVHSFLESQGFFDILSIINDCILVYRVFGQILSMNPAFLVFRKPSLSGILLLKNTDSLTEDVYPISLVLVGCDRRNIFHILVDQPA